MGEVTRMFENRLEPREIPKKLDSRSTSEIVSTLQRELADYDPPESRYHAIDGVVVREDRVFGNNNSAGARYARGHSLLDDCRGRG